MVYRQIIGHNRGEILLPVLYRRSGLMIEWSLLALKAMNLLFFCKVHLKRSNFQGWNISLKDQKLSKMPLK